ncbi:hypothetical protein [Rickettsia endosymbiont of Gonocerus acuteangulatus]|uniref:hypothetical protein n=1 Tax=Rickettsia endosymbiont of Gonocerus acuteangulatus TaxID=3066266 RepID=UPI003978939A
MSEITTNTNELINDISVLINNAKVRVAIKANAERTMLYTFDISRFGKLNFGIRLCSRTFVRSAGSPLI